jgi:exodeoxyribonuclease-5
MLNELQQIAVERILSFIETDFNREKWCITLSGFAGTGKTYTIAQALLQYDSSFLSKIAICAPTHKAKKVLHDSLTSMGVVVGSVSSLHQVLGLQVGEDEDTGVSKLLEGGAKQTLLNTLVLIVDECGMIDDDIYGEIKLQARGFSVKVIFLGDVYQLPPVGSTTTLSKTFDCETLYLTQQMRHSGLISDLCEYAQKCVELKDLVNSTKIIMSVMLDTGSDAVEIISKGEQISPSLYSTARFLASTNQTVNKLIKQIRSERGLSESNFTVGEEIVFYSRFETQGKQHLIQNSSTGIVFDVDLSPPRISTVFDLLRPHTTKKTCLPEFLRTAYTVALRMDDNNEITIPYFPLWEKFVTELKDMCFKRKAIKYQTYAAVLAQIPQFKSAYCLTVHKSQGSTFPSVVVWDDFAWAIKQPLQLQARLWYVALSRAKEKLTIVTG